MTLDFLTAEAEDELVLRETPAVTGLQPYCLKDGDMTLDFISAEVPVAGDLAEAEKTTTGAVEDSDSATTNTKSAATESETATSPTAPAPTNLRNMGRQTTKSIRSLQATIDPVDKSPSAPLPATSPSSTCEESVVKWAHSVVVNQAAAVTRTGIVLAYKQELARDKVSRQESNVVALACLIDGLYQARVDTVSGDDWRTVVPPNNPQVLELLTEVRAARGLAESALIATENTRRENSNNQLDIAGVKKIVNDLPVSTPTSIATDPIFISAYELLKKCDREIANLKVSVGNSLTSGPLPPPAYNISLDPLFLNIYDVVKKHTKSIDTVRREWAESEKSTASTKVIVRGLEASSLAHASALSNLQSLAATDKMHTGTIEELQRQLAAMRDGMNTLSDDNHSLREEITKLSASLAGAQISSTAVRASVVAVEGAMNRLLAGPPNSGVLTTGIPSLPLINASENSQNFFGGNSRSLPQVPTFPQDDASARFFQDSAPPSKRPRIDIGPAYGLTGNVGQYGGQVWTVQYGLVVGVGPPVEAIRRIIQLAGLFLGDTIPHSEYANVDGGITVLVKVRTLEKANRLVAAVMNGGHSELAGKKARLLEG